MKRNHTLACLFSALTLLVAVGNPACAQEGIPLWAYHSTQDNASIPAKADDGSQRTVPDSTVTMTLTQTRNRFMPPDWHPEAHQAMPQSVLHGREPKTYACAFCHRTEGQGGADSANISGLDADYIVRQLQEMRSHARQSAVDQRLPMVLKSHVTGSISDEEIVEAARYYASLPGRSYVKVVETETVPKTVAYLNLWLVPSPAGGTEPLGQRIIEMPDDHDRFELRDTRAPFTTFVPKGSIERGRALVASGGASGVGCESCHGEGLKGGTAPKLAGQYATYLVRQFWDFQSGRRKGDQADQMATVVDNLPLADMIALAAYAASLPR